MLAAANQFLREHLPVVHRGLKRTASKWMAGSSEVMPVAKMLGGHIRWMHPRFLTWDLDGIEPQVFRWLDEYLRPGNVFFDVGANYGFHTLRAAALVKRTGSVVAFEPAPPNVRILEYHCRHNKCGWVTVVPEAVSAESGDSVEFFLVDGGDGSGNSLTIGQPDAAFYTGASVERRTRTLVRTVSLDDFSERARVAPDLIKIDVEGAELLVLRGASRLLETERPKLIVAVHPFWLPQGQTVEGMLSYLHDFGYKVFGSSGEEARSLGFGEYLCLPK